MSISEPVHGTVIWEHEGMTGFIVKHCGCIPHIHMFFYIKFLNCFTNKSSALHESARSLQFELFMDDLGPGVISCLNISCN